MLKISVVQMNSKDDIKYNLDQAEKFISQAHSAGSQLVLLPENFSFMGTEEQKLNISEKFGQGITQDFIANLAVKYNMWIIAGTIPIEPESKLKDINKVYAASVLYSSDGKAVCRYDKMHLFDVKVSEKESYCESDIITPGSETKIYKTPFAKIGLSVCYDLRFPELYRKYSEEKVDIISIPSAFTYDTGKMHWSILNQARAIENQCIVMASDQCGAHPDNRKTYGHSMIIDYLGKIISEQEIKPGIITSEINLKAMHDLRASFPVLEHRKIK